MHWSIYADLSRGLSPEERSAIAAALDAVVPSGGCVGLQNGSVEEVYFTLEAGSEAEARAEAHRHVEVVLRNADVKAEYSIQVEPMPGT
ncbi:hypothetical protein [Pyxidicoccus xibeiensis]|uniref:hypothetical protein n=1 Tax=Pyxidicoccus xibeiensis TaxID=2906759 RepID=UPI0020A7E9CE|nr:hypothetical protein [Pyxidicoccus xibeiensis]MCP3138601.1 hypothetical protein [Pyxidicoccus xibeiensis]